MGGVRECPRGEVLGKYLWGEVLENATGGKCWGNAPRGIVGEYLWGKCWGIPQGEVLGEFGCIHCFIVYDFRLLISFPFLRFVLNLLTNIAKSPLVPCYILSESEVSLYFLAVLVLISV